MAKRHETAIVGSDVKGWFVHCLTCDKRSSKISTIGTAKAIARAHRASPEEDLP